MTCATDRPLPVTSGDSSLDAVADTSVQAAPRQRTIMGSADLRGKCAQTVGSFYVHSVDEGKVGRGGVQTRLTRESIAEAGLTNHLALARVHEAARVAEGMGLTADLTLELGLRFRDLGAGAGVVEPPEVRMGPTVRLESQDAGRIEQANLLPAQRRGSPGSPAIRSVAADDSRSDKDGGREAELGEHGMRVVQDVLESVVKRDRDGSRFEFSCKQQVEGRHRVQRLKAVRRQVLHLPTELDRTKGQRVGFVGDPVVEEDTQSALRIVGRRPPSAHARLR